MLSVNLSSQVSTFLGQGQKPEDVSSTLNMLTNLKNVSFDPNNVGNLSALIRLLGGDPLR